MDKMRIGGSEPKFCKGGADAGHGAQAVCRRCGVENSVKSSRIVNGTVVEQVACNIFSRESD